jgi:hypothetical protein
MARRDVFQDRGDRLGHRNRDHSHVFALPFCDRGPGAVPS